MAMLAEVKRKASWVLNPRASDWSKDQNKLGQKMLEKMGWSVGKGLGANEQGPVEAIRVTHKANVRGLGAERKKEQEYWLNQQENFQSLLEQLNGGSDQTVEVKSLEHRSKTSKTRVHYHKFTRGKDISRYSKKDLSCIVGAAPPPKILKGSANAIQQDEVQELKQEKEHDSSEDENRVNMKLRSQTVLQTDEELPKSDLPSLKPKKTKKSAEKLGDDEEKTIAATKKGKKLKIKNNQEIIDSSSESDKKRSRKRKLETSDNMSDQTAINQKEVKKASKGTKKAIKRLKNVEEEANPLQKLPLTESITNESLITEKNTKTKKAAKEKKSKRAQSQKPVLLEMNDSCSDVMKQEQEDEMDLGSINSQSSLFNQMMNAKTLKSPEIIAVPASVVEGHILYPDNDTEDIKSLEEELTGVSNVKKKKKKKKKAK